VPSADRDPLPAALITLSFVLSLSFLLIILSCALWGNWLPLLTGASFSLLLSLRLC